LYSNRNMRVKRENTIAVVVDIQSRLFPIIHDHDTVLKNNRILISGLKVLKIPVVVTQQYTKGLGGIC